MTLFFVLIGLVTGPSQAVAADVPQSFTLDGRIFSDTNGTNPLQDGAIGFTIQILDEDKVCVLYEESQTVSTLASKGFFSIQVGSEVGSPRRSVGDSANAMPTIFQNINSVNGKLLANGAPCIVGATGGKRRYVRVKILPPTMGGLARTLSPDLTIDSVPNAIIAERAETLQGLRASNVLQVNTASGSQLTQSNLESLFTSTSRFNSLSSVVDGTSSSYMRSNSSSGAQLPSLSGAPSSPTPGSVWFDSGDNRVKYQTSVGPVTLGTGSGTVTSVGLTLPSEMVAGTPVTTNGTISVTWATQTANKVFAAPDAVTGTPTFRVMVANDIPNLPWTKITSLLPTTLLGYGITDAVRNLGGTPSFESGLNAAKGAATTAGRIWISTDTKEIYRDNGAAWDLLGTSASGTVTSVSSANNYLTVTTGTTTPSLTVNVGTVANTVAAGNDARITGALQQATAFSGDVTGVYSATSVDRIRGTGVSITALGTGNFLRYNGTNWVNTALSLSDVTTGLGYTPVNRAGDTMTGLLVLSADPSANLGAATKQYIDSTVATAASNAATATANALTSANTYSDTKFITRNLPAAPGAGQNGQSVRWNNGSNVWEYYTAGSGGGDFMASGAVPMTGALVNNTNSGSSAVAVTQSGAGAAATFMGGNVGIGTTSPGEKLEVNGALLVSQNGSAAAPAIRINNDNTGIFQPLDDIIAFSTTGTERMRIGDIVSVSGRNTSTVRIQGSGTTNTDAYDQAALELFESGANVGATISLTSPAASENRLQFSLSSSATPRMVIEDITGSVGIGTTNPAVKLNILTDGTADNGIRSETSGGGYGPVLSLKHGGASGRNFYITSTGTSNGPGAGKLEVFDATATQTRMVIDASGNMGIGTTAPATTLDVNGAQTFRGVAAASAPPTAAQGKIYFDSTANKFKVSENNGAYVDLVGGGGTVTSVLSANSYLSVATGTTTPSLTVNVGTAANTVAAGNDSRITGALQQATAFSGDVTGVYSATSVDRIRGTGVSITALGTGNFLRYNGTNWVNTALSLGDVTTGLGYTPVNRAGDTMTGLLVLSADPSANLGAATKQYIDSSTATAATAANTYADTKFITRNLPAAPGAGQNGQSVRWNNGSNVWEYYTAGSGGGDFMASGTVPMTGALRMGGNTINGDSTASGTLTLDSTSNATKGNIVLAPSGGNVGVGTTTPATIWATQNYFANTTPKVEVLTGSSSGSYQEAFVIRHSDVDVSAVNRRLGMIMKLSDESSAVESEKMGGMVLESALAYGNSPSLHFLTLDQKRLTIDSTGNVGIGATEPDIRLRVIASGDVSSIGITRPDNTTDAARIQFQPDGSPSGSNVVWDFGMPANSNSFVLTTWDGSTAFSPFVVTNTGSVGIGTTTPDVPLEVAGIVKSANLWLTDDGTPSSNAIDFTNNTGGIGIYRPGDNILGFSTNSLERMRIDNAGNVGIGVTSPQAALDIVSTGTSSAVIVPRATTGNRPTTLVNGMIRYNTTTALFEFYQNGGWRNYTTVSDGRLKTNVTPVNQGLDIINQLNPVFFDWDQNNPRAQGFGSKHQVGFIAQEVEQVLPEVVNKGEDSYRSVEYGKIVSVVVAAVKELYAKVMGHDEKIQAQDREIASVKADNVAKDRKIKELEQRLERIEKSLKSK